MRAEGFRISRRQSVAGLSVLGLGGLLIPPAYAQRKRTETTGVGTSAVRPTDEDIFTFALNLEYMEAEFYLRATTGRGISDSDAGPDAGQVVGGGKANFSNVACPYHASLGRKSIRRGRCASSCRSRPPELPTSRRA
jgi:Ferritin-like domain